MISIHNYYIPSLKYCKKVVNCKRIFMQGAMVY